MLYRGLKTVPISLYCYHFGPGFILRSLHHNKYDFTPLNAHKKKSQVFTMPLVITPVYLNSQDSGLFGTVGFFFYTKAALKLRNSHILSFPFLKKNGKKGACRHLFWCFKVTVPLQVLMVPGKHHILLETFIKDPECGQTIKLESLKKRNNMNPTIIFISYMEIICRSVCRKWSP